MFSERPFSFLNLYFKIVLMVLIWYVRWHKTKDFKVFICFCHLSSVSVRIQLRFQQGEFNIGICLKDTGGSEKRKYLKPQNSTEVLIMTVGSSPYPWARRKRGEVGLTEAGCPRGGEVLCPVLEGSCENIMRQVPRAHVDNGDHNAGLLPR